MKMVLQTQGYGLWASRTPLPQTRIHDRVPLAFKKCDFQCAKQAKIVYFRVHCTVELCQDVQDVTIEAIVIDFYTLGRRECIQLNMSVTLTPFRHLQITFLAAQQRRGPLCNTNIKAAFTGKCHQQHEAREKHKFVSPLFQASGVLDGHYRNQACAQFPTIHLYYFLSVHVAALSEDVQRGIIEIS